MKKSELKKYTIVLYASQIISTFKQSLSLAVKKREFRFACYLFLVRNSVSIFGNRAGLSNKRNSNLTLPLREEGFMELNKLPENTVKRLVEYFLQSQQSEYASLKEYFEKHRNDNYVRSKPIDVLLNDDLTRCVLTGLGILPIISEFLNLPESEIVMSANVDASFKIDGERKLRNGYDDALEFHRDVDSLRFVKAFVYLVDIEKGFGEHEICIGSHKSIPFSLRTIHRQTYSNLKANLSNFTLKSIFGKAGYSWVEDTTTFHRGTVPTLGDRLILTLSFNDKKSNLALNGHSYQPLELFYPLVSE